MDSETPPEGEGWSRADYVEFVRKNHPDFGGDPAVFQAGLARFRAARGDGAEGADASGVDRYAAPVVGVGRGPVLRRWVRRLRRWRARRRHSRVR